MKNYTKIGIFCLVCLMALSALTPMALGDPTTIDDSTYPASEGEAYKWVCTFCEDSGDPYIGEGSYYKITIGTITRGSYFSITNALIVSATLETYLKGPDTLNNTFESNFLIYNATLEYFNMSLGMPPFIVPIPLVLDLIADWMESEYTGTAVVSGNSIIFYRGLFTETLNYNSDGFCTSYTNDYEGERILTYELEGGGGGDEIPFDNYFIIPTVITIGVIVIFVKKRRSINNYK
jgi:hypothetical protein